METGELNKGNKEQQSVRRLRIESLSAFLFDSNTELYKAKREKPFDFSLYFSVGATGFEPVTLCL